MLGTYTFSGLELVAGIIIFAFLLNVLANIYQRYKHGKVDYQASQDSLTGLTHRREFEKILKMALDSAHKEGKHHALIYMDIDIGTLLGKGSF